MIHKIEKNRLVSSRNKLIQLKDSLIQKINHCFEQSFTKVNQTMEEVESQSLAFYFNEAASLTT